MAAIDYNKYAESIKRGLSYAKEGKDLAKKFGQIAKKTTDYGLGTASGSKSLDMAKAAKQQAAKAIRSAKHLSQYSGGIKALRKVGLGPKTFKMTRLHGFTTPSAIGLGLVSGAAYVGAKLIKGAERKAVKSIEAQHSPASMARHAEQIKAIQAQRKTKRKSAAKSLRSTIVKSAGNPMNYIPRKK